MPEMVPNGTENPKKEAAAAQLTPPLKYHGGKSYLARRILALMPRHTHYCECFAGGLAVLLAKNPAGCSEVVNDFDSGLTNFWRVLANDDTFRRFSRIVQAVPFSETEWRDAGDRLDDPDPVAGAAAFFIRCRQSLAGRMDSFAPLSRTRTRRNMNEQASAWIGAVDGLPAVHARLRQVAILNRPAVEVIRSQDGPGTLFYCDPPYLKSTRSAPDVYALEMSEGDHSELLEALRTCRGKVMVSGYPSDLYDSALADWTRHTFDLPNNAAGGKAKGRETEVLWCNFPPSGVA
jgi:DNA adenine methylase